MRFHEHCQRPLCVSVCSGGPAWAGAGARAGARAELLPPLLRAVSAWGAGDRLRRHGVPVKHSPDGAIVAQSPATRRNRGGALAWAALVEAAARADCGSLPPAHAARAAAAAHPAHKWLYVRGAQWSGAGAEAADAALERQLRLHALPDELAASDADATAADATAADATAADLTAADAIAADATAAAGRPAA
ncbi:uncharacterized protein LOC114351638 [Ostrinia furnacalis]|uniref:uncharacterized protein LOC114351638 n=1 Tax=Ostrinia furnacalis TaxID=93504 RepID=UPI00103B00C7|nr:uncharacterized protein LOC114351638 [Ostrinia furnacalis]